MELERRILLTLIGAVLGFLLSQSVNLVNYLRRPKFRIDDLGGGIKSSYTGDPPEVPAEIDLGFYLENTGSNAAKNTRVFLSEIEVSDDEDGPWEYTSFEFSELEKPIDILPPRKKVLIPLAKITTDEPFLNLRIQRAGDDELEDRVRADTLGKKFFRVEILVVCDDQNSVLESVFILKPSTDKWVSSAIWFEGRNYVADVYSK